MLWVDDDKALVMKFFNDNTMYKYGETFEKDGKRQERVFCKGKECCREYVEIFLLGHPINELVTIFKLIEELKFKKIIKLLQIECTKIEFDPIKLFKKYQKVILKNDDLDDMAYATMVSVNNDEEYEVRLKNCIHAKKLIPLVGIIKTK